MAPGSENTICMYSNAFRTANLSIPISTIFTRPAGYLTSYTPTYNFEFSTKKYVDDAVASATGTPLTCTYAPRTISQIRRYTTT